MNDSNDGFVLAVLKEIKNLIELPKCIILLLLHLYFVLCISKYENKQFKNLCARMIYRESRNSLPSINNFKQFLNNPQLIISSQNNLLPSHISRSNRSNSMDFSYISPIFCLLEINNVVAFCIISKKNVIPIHFIIAWNQNTNSLVLSLYSPAALRGNYRQERGSNGAIANDNFPLLPYHFLFSLLVSLSTAPRTRDTQTTL